MPASELVLNGTSTAVVLILFGNAVKVEADDPNVNSGFGAEPAAVVDGTPKLNDAVFSPPRAGQVVVAVTGAAAASALNLTPKLNLDVVSNEIDFEGPNGDALA